ncbi:MULTISPECIES: enterobactin transporter EntS [Rhodococcus]|uniref:enterobactin transporter EntS n=1 Tax=Rhodococcus TaxID=1827 RepID=UPI001E57D069|nr:MULTISPECIES: enterobactin transporter EntS [Rhodococcus]MCD2119276.1 enterobactin transporter EntS [Rhodococcus pyridinivorans]MCZ4628136.1 enterobactin transporter EntS [Rhodococcus pyridinivorans]MCZ4649332.1 enterobactin transporter EntS [Rhodococcus pyridinivorans]MDJ0482489.1 enterobactin transporter EntS [Rhodococcus pyridinivorans]MDV7255481.1 enterobactin transporter EntS [Rhodococcus pyridinivorans]
MSNGALFDLRPLRESAAFRRIFIARTISIFGIGMLMVGVPIQVYDLTGSSPMVGLVSALEGGAAIGGMLLGGMLADRYNRTFLILFARTVSGLTFVGLAVNAGLSSPSVPAIIALTVVNGLIGSISIAALLAVVPTLVPKDQLVAVGALNVLSARAGAVLSPALGGLVIATFSVAWNYWVAAIGTAVTVTLLSGLPALNPPTADAGHDADAPAETVTGFLRRERVVGGVMIAGVVAMLGGGVLVLVPAFADARFEGNAVAIGVMYAAIALGAAAATVTSGWLGRSVRPGRVLLTALVLGFVVQALVGFTSVLALTVVLLVIVGVFGAVQEVLRYSLIQTHTPHTLLGRVNGLWSAQEVAGMSVGALVAGLFGGIFDAPDAVVWYSAAMAVLALLVTLVLRRLRGATVEPSAHPVTVE